MIIKDRESLLSTIDIARADLIYSRLNKNVFYVFKYRYGISTFVTKSKIEEYKSKASNYLEIPSQVKDKEDQYLVLDLEKI